MMIERHILGPITTRGRKAWATCSCGTDVTTSRAYRGENLTLKVFINHRAHVARQREKRTK